MRHGGAWSGEANSLAYLNELNGKRALTPFILKKAEIPIDKFQ